MGEKPNTSSHSPVSDSRSLLTSSISCACIGSVEIITPPTLIPHLPIEALKERNCPTSLHCLPLLSAFVTPARFLSGRRCGPASFCRRPQHSLARCSRSSYFQESR